MALDPVTMTRGTSSTWTQDRYFGVHHSTSGQVQYWVMYCHVLASLHRPWKLHSGEAERAGAKEKPRVREEKIAGKNDWADWIHVLTVGDPRDALTH